MSDYQISAIGHIQSPYKQKFAIPRQPRLVPEAKAKLIFAKEFNREEFVRGLDEFSHIWLLFRFHETADKGYSAMVRPPRLGGNERKGVFATRATFRPNAIGMSAVKQAEPTGLRPENPSDAGPNIRMPSSRISAAPARMPRILPMNVASNDLIISLSSQLVTAFR